MQTHSKKKNKNISSIGRKLVRDLEENVYCRLRASKTQGVGVFAIRDIPKGKELFKSFLEYHLTPVPSAFIFDNPKIPKEVADLANDMFPMHKGKLYLYRGGMNAIDVGFFVNHSKHPNVMTKKDSGSFFAGRNIKKGEELLVDYTEYTENASTESRR